MPAAAPLKFRAEQDTHIEAVFHNNVTTRGGTPADTPGRCHRAMPPRHVWRTIPSGESWMGCVPSDRPLRRSGEPAGATDVPTAVRDARPRSVGRRLQGIRGSLVSANAATARMVRGRHASGGERHVERSDGLLQVGSEAACRPRRNGSMPPAADSKGKLFPWGDEFTGQANGRHNLKTEQFNFTTPVASFPPNAFGLHDMAGNVWEWTASAFTMTHASTPDGNGQNLRTIKGGGWDNLDFPAACVQSARRCRSRAGITCTSASDAFDHEKSGSRRPCSRSGPP